MAGFAAGFADLEVTAEREPAVGDLVVPYGVLRGTNIGEWMGIPATNRRIRLPWMDMHRVVDCKMTESWHIED